MAAGRESHWREVMSRYLASDLTIAAFCKNERISEGNFYAWKKRLGISKSSRRPYRAKRNSTKSKRFKSTRSDSGFMPVRVQHKESPSIQIKWPHGVALELPAKLSGKEVASVLVAVHDALQNGGA